jgi:hypothetical protein
MMAQKSRYLVHFYMHENTRYFSSDLRSSLMGGEVAGTPHHGRCHADGTHSPVCVHNCFSLDKEFLGTIQKATVARDEELAHYELGIVLDRNAFAPNLVIDVYCHGVDPSTIPVMDLHRYDSPTGRLALQPFNYCNVVRIEWPPTNSKLPKNALVGAIVLLTRGTEVHELLRIKGFSEAFVCQLQELGDQPALKDLQDLANWIENVKGGGVKPQEGQPGPKSPGVSSPILSLTPAAKEWVSVGSDGVATIDKYAKLILNKKFYKQIEQAVNDHNE